ncbi:MAG: hypothetical protein SFU98_16095 [Leptospiraceae bacterium]|nr:hypothetical protein [Leptospiraceae bacterium]
MKHLTKLLILTLILLSIQVNAFDRRTLRKVLDGIDRNPSMTLTLHFQGHGHFAPSILILHSKSGPANSEDVLEDLVINDSDIQISFTNRGSGSYFNDIYINLNSISIIHVTKYNVDIYVGSMQPSK